MEEKLFMDGLKVVEKLNKRKPASSLGVTQYNFERYKRLAKESQRIKRIVQQHKELVKYWAIKITSSLKAGKRSKKALERFILDSHGETPPLGSMTSDFQIPSEAIIAFVKSAGRKKALSLLDKAQEIAGKTETDKLHQFLEKEISKNTSAHLTSHAAGILNYILRNAWNNIHK